MQAQGIAVLPHLDGDIARALVQLRHVLGIDFLRLMSGLCEQQRHRLREVRVEQLVEFVPRVEIAEHGGRQPDQRNAAEKRKQQAPLEGEGIGRFAHGASRGII